MIQFKPDCEENIITDFNEFDQKAFDAFQIEIKQDVKQKIKDMGTQHIEFSGQITKGKKEGKGAYVEKSTKNFYYGSWINDMRNGYGIIFFGEGNEFNLQLFDDINKYRSKDN